jgi:hypothetical protein
VPFARIATAAAVTLLLTLTGCGHESTPTTVAAPAVTSPDVPLETATVDPAGTDSPAPEATVSKKRAHRPPPPAAPPPADAVSGTAGQDRFVAAVQRRLPKVTLDRRDEEVEDLGEQACAALGHGRSATAAAGEVAEQGVTPADARTLVGLAKDNLCRA